LDVHLSDGSRQRLRTDTQALASLTFANALRKRADLSGLVTSKRFSAVLHRQKIAYVL